MNKQTQFICLWSAPVFGMLMTIGWWLLADFVPPPLPSSGAAEITAMFESNASNIRLGMVFMMAGLMFWMPFIAVTSAQIARMESSPHVLAYAQLLGGALSVVPVFLSAMIWAAIAFRTGRDPQTVLILNDLAWLFTTMPFGAIVVQMVAIGLAILGDRSEQRIMPRWVAFVNFWVALLSMPAALIIFFHTGPFAWNGLIAFWIPLAAFSIWFPAMIYALYTAIKNQPGEA
jgi:hypothetical protein